MTNKEKMEYYLEQVMVYLQTAVSEANKANEYLLSAVQYGADEFDRGGLLSDVAEFLNHIRSSAFSSVMSVSAVQAESQQNTKEGTNEQV